MSRLPQPSTRRPGVPPTAALPGVASLAAAALAACVWGCDSWPAAQTARWLDLGSAAVPTECDSVAGLVPAPIADASAVGDSAFLVVDAEGTVRLFGPGLSERWALQPAPAPGAPASRPVSAAIAGDTLLLADLAYRGLRRHRIGGAELAPLPLPFPVVRVRARPTLLVAPLPSGEVDRLLYRIGPGGPEPLSPRAEPHDDGALRALLNRVALAGDDLGWLLAGSLVRPRAWVGDAGGRAERVPVPLAASAAALEGRIPPLPLGLGSPVLVAAVDVAIDPTSGDFLILTTSGRRGAGGVEMAIIRTDRRLVPKRVHRLDVPARTLLYDGRLRRALVAGEVGPWSACSL